MKPISVDGAPPRRTTSDSFDWPGHRASTTPSSTVLPLELLLLIAAGSIAVLLHASFRLPLRMPGYHGVEWFAILMLARLSSNRASAGLIAGLGAAGAIWTMHGVGMSGQAVQAFVYLLQGALIDALLFRSRTRLPFYAWLPIVGAIAHMTAPLLRNVLMSLSAGTLQFGSLMHGLAFPLATHALFGAAGATVGLLAYLAIQRVRR